MRIGPVEVEDWTPDCWRASLIIDNLHYMDYWYSKSFNGARTEGDIAKLYLEDLKRECRRHGGMFSIGSYERRFHMEHFIKEIQLALLFLQCEED